MNNVLDLAKIEAGANALREEAFSPTQLFQTVIELMSQTARAKGIQLRLEIDPAIPADVFGDQGKLRQMLVNLVGNAVKFTSKGSVTVRVRFSHGKEALSGILSVEVEDTGVGIAPEDRERIFEPFVQVHRLDTQPGTGLGLTLTKQFAELMGGTVTLTSEPGQGSRFGFSVKLKVSSIPSVQISEAAPRRLAPGQRSPKVLVAEDQWENRELLSRILEGAGFTVLTVTDGEEAVNAFQTWGPEFICMDWRMPRVDGLEATRRIRSLPGGQAVKIVVLSASVFHQDRKVVLASGADGFEPKPVVIDRLIACLADHLGLQLERPAPLPTELHKSNTGATALNRLSPGTRESLREALTSLDSVRIGTAIDLVTQENPELGSHLQEKISKFQYTSILEVLSRESAP